MIGKRTLIFYISVISLVSSCAETNEKEISNLDTPPKYKNLENLTVFQPSTQSYDTVLFERAQEFKSNEEVFFEGYTGDAIIDDRGRLFIVVSKPAQVAIYVFGADGRFVTKLGRHGRGPGEFESISAMESYDDELYVYDSRQQKISIFSMDDYVLLYEESVKRDKVKSDDELPAIMTGNNLYVRDDSTMIMSFKSRMLTEGFRNILLYRLSGDGMILPGKIIELKNFRFYMPETSKTPEGYIRMPQPMPFSRTSLIAVSEDGPIYTAWTEDFLIKVYDKNGTYQRAFYQPYDKSTLSVSDMEIGNESMKIINENRDQIPKTWPALHTMFIDDQNRLWILTITDSKENYSGWILNTKGELLARFIWPDRRSSRSVRSKPLMIVKNGYLYTRERNIREGIDQIVKHKIIFNKR